MHPTRGAINLLIWTIVFTVLDFIFVALRLLSAKLTHRRLAPDDYFIIFALINTTALSTIIIWAVFSSGMGHFETQISHTELVNSLKLIPAAYVTWTLSTTCFKLSILFFYVRIFNIKAFKYLSYGLMCLTVGYCISFLVVFLSTCSPNISQLWNPRPHGHCRNLNIGQLGSVSTNLGIDILILILPMPFLWKLQMSLRNKVVITILFSFSFVTMGIMIWRIQHLITTANEDFVFNLPTLALTTILEMVLCIIIACIPTLAPVVKAYIYPVATKISGKSSSGLRITPISIVTFGRGRVGGPRRNKYTTMDYGSQDPMKNDVEAGKDDTRLVTSQENAFTNTYVTSEPSANDVELANIHAKNAIYVQQGFDTGSSQQHS